jgi:uncharacterized protein GlcG (DUF336 family)
MTANHHTRITRGALMAPVTPVTSAALTALAALAALTAFVLVAAPAGAQRLASKPALTLDGAKAVAAAAVAEARRTSSAGVIAVVDDGGQLMYLERLDTTFPMGATISIGKARTAALFKRPSKAFEDIIKNGRTAMVALSDFTPLQGGEPITVDGQIVGAVGVSGATSADADEQIALAGAHALAAPAAARAGSGAAASASNTASPVLYFTHAQVASSFAKGAVLFDGAGDRNYMIHTSRRDRDGMAEVHAVDTDIIYVTGGTATLRTGGSVVDSRPTAPDELRGAGIDGGESRRLREGDVIVVPRGVPHQFQDVRAAFTYYTIKVR